MFETGLKRFFRSFIEKTLYSKTRKPMPPKTTYHWKEEQVREMISLYESGMTLTEVGAEFGISKQRVEQIFKKTGV